MFVCSIYSYVGFHIGKEVSDEIHNTGSIMSFDANV